MIFAKLFRPGLSGNPFLHRVWGCTKKIGNGGRMKAPNKYDENRNKLTFFLSKSAEICDFSWKRDFRKINLLNRERNAKNNVTLVEIKLLIDYRNSIKL